MKNTALLIAILGALLLPNLAQAQKPGTRSVSGTVFRDPNYNGRLDPNEKGGAPATLWLYRINANGSRVKVRQITTDQVGNYRFPNIPFGRYFLAIRYGSSRFAVVGRPFRLRPQGPHVVRNIPYMTGNTVNRYDAYSPTGNPGNLDQDVNVSPHSPNS